MASLITGVAGFIGSSLAHRLLTEGERVVGVDMLTDYYDPKLKKANLAKLAPHENFTFIPADLRSMDLVPHLREVEAVYHQAGQPGVRKSWGTEFSHYVDNNIAATQNILEAARHAPGLKRFVYASSSSVYGDSETYPTSESVRPAPRSPYGVSKLAAEHLCSLYAANFGVPTVSLRYFTVYGPGQRPDMAFTRFISAALQGEEIQVYGDGEQVRDFTYVNDVVDANIAAASIDSVPGTVLNIAGGTQSSVRSVLQMLGAMVETPLSIAYGPKVDGDVVRTSGDANLAREVLGWTPRVALADGLSAQLEWLRRARHDRLEK